MDRSLHIANCILLLNNFDELKNYAGKLLYKIDNREDRILFYFPTKDLNFIIYLNTKKVYYESRPGSFDKNMLHLLYKIVDLFKKEFFSDEEEKQNGTREILF